MGIDMLAETAILHEAVVQGHRTPQMPILPLLLLSLRRGSLHLGGRQHYAEGLDHFLAPLREASR